MPSKGKRMAARQGSLRRRRSNHNRSAAAGGVGADMDTGTAAAGGAVATAAASASVATAGGSSGAAAPAGAGRGRPAILTTPRGRRAERPAAYNHVGSELVRIGIFAGVLVVALAAIALVL